MKRLAGITDDLFARINYDLAKKVPDMARGFVIQTDYGDLEISAKDAPKFMKLAEKLLLAKVYKAGE